MTIEIIDMIPAIVMAFSLCILLPTLGAYEVGKSFGTNSLITRITNNNFNSYYFNDEVMISSRFKFYNQFKTRLINMLAYIVLLVGTVAYFEIMIAQHLTPDQRFNCGAVFSPIYLLLTTTFFGRLGSARSRFKTTFLASQEDQNEFFNEIIDKEFKEKVVLFIKKNPKEHVSSLDVLYWGAYAKKLNDDLSTNLELEKKSKLNQLKGEINE